MNRDLYKTLCNPEVLKIAANYVYDDKKDDFIPDVFRNQDYIFNLQENLERLAQSLKNGTYRPRPLKEIDVPKSGLAVRPGSSLDIEDHTVFFAIAYLLAPTMDRVLPESVFHFRVKKKGKRPHPDKLFQNEGPVLIRKVLRKALRIFEDWYEAWPEFVAEAQNIFEKEGFTIMVESDISAYFENISHPLLADILRQYAPHQLHLINLLMEMLSVWATPSLTGYRPQRGIPQGNEVSSWLGTLYLVEMDIELLTPADIDTIAGGDYWYRIVTSDIPFSDKEAQCVSEYMRLMKRYFDEVCSYGIKEKYEHAIPKYRLLFGSRHEDAFILMNDAICNARDKFLGKQRVNGYLFDMRADDEIHDPDRLRKAIMDKLTTSMTRKELIVRAMHGVFAEYKELEYKRMIGSLLKEGKFCSKSGKTRINDHEVLSPKASFNGRCP